MARITLEYNPHNLTASRIVEFLMSLDNIFRVESQEKKPNWRTRKAIRDAHNGKNVKSFNSFEEYKKFTDEYVRS